MRLIPQTDRQRTWLFLIDFAVIATLMAVLNQGLRVWVYAIIVALLFPVKAYLTQRAWRKDFPGVEPPRMPFDWDNTEKRASLSFSIPEGKEVGDLREIRADGTAIDWTDPREPVLKSDPQAVNLVKHWLQEVCDERPGLRHRIGVVRTSILIDMVSKYGEECRRDLAVKRGVAP
jgi:hypothetical protein